MTLLPHQINLLDGFSICRDCEDNKLCDACQERRELLIIKLKVGGVKATNQIRIDHERRIYSSHAQT